MNAIAIARLGLGLGLAAGLLAGSLPAQLVRAPNTTLQLPSIPPQFGYALTNAFPGLSFVDPVVITRAPGETNRLFVVEQPGRIYVITNLASPTRTLFLDITSRVRFGGEQGLLGLAFHPGYATNRYFYVFYTGNTNGNQTSTGDSTRHDRLARYEASPVNPHQGLPGSELILISQRDEASNHNGGDLHFGPDGYLYVALGDEGGGNDNYNNSQTITRDFFAGILRLDVDLRPGNLAPNPHPASSPHYAVPADNPYVGATEFNGQAVNPAQVRTEFWAVGLRNPWRMSFDPATGWLYSADVGQNAWEEVNVIVRGGNYGWAYREGRHAGPKTPPPGFSGIDPILEYGHGTGLDQGRSITGGVVYHGEGLPELQGRYIFADYVSGNVWATYYDGATATPSERLLGETGIAAFGVDPSNGDVLVGDLNDDSVKRLVPVQTGGNPLPETLADTGAFADLSTLAPHPGIVPYDVNVPFWSDNGLKRRWFSLPSLAGRIVFRPDSSWGYIGQAVWIKHFELELTNGVAASRRRLETRFLVRGGAEYGVTYRWDETQANAVLVPAAGLDEAFVIDEGGGVLRTQVWHYPGRNECLVCHTREAGFALSFNTPQMNREFDHGAGPENQITALQEAGYFFNALTPADSWRALAPLEDESHSVEQRVRSWLTANCIQCHASGSFDAGLFTPLSATGLINGEPRNTLGDPENRLVRPGEPERSMLLARITTNGPLRMPPLASSVLDTQAIALVNRWITNDLAGYQTYPEWQLAWFGSTDHTNAQPTADVDEDNASNELEWLTKTSPTNAAEAWGIQIEPAGSRAELVFERVANRGFEVLWSTNLLAGNSWRFLNVPENRPYFAATNQSWRVPVETEGNPARFYRVRVYEP